MWNDRYHHTCVWCWWMLWQIQMTLHTSALSMWNLTCRAGWAQNCRKMNSSYLLPEDVDTDEVGITLYLPKAKQVTWSSQLNSSRSLTYHVGLSNPKSDLTIEDDAGRKGDNDYAREAFLSFPPNCGTDNAIGSRHSILNSLLFCQYRARLNYEAYILLCTSDWLEVLQKFSSRIKIDTI